MIANADANIFVRLYLEFEEDDSERLLNREDIRQAWPLPVTDLLRFEVRNALQRMVFESNHGSLPRTSPEAAAAAQANFDEDLNAGHFLVRVPKTLWDIETHFDQLALRHTAKHGFRTYDIMHVASALALGCQKFLSFDGNALKLAKLEGLLTK